MVNAIDLDGNGTIDLDEFIVLLRNKRTGKYQQMTFEDELKQAFQVFDGDGNGEIDADELATIMKALGEKLSKQDIEFMIKSIDIVKYYYYIYLLSQNRILIALIIMILKKNQNSDGAIDFKEFKKMMQLAPIPQDTITTKCELLCL